MQRLRGRRFIALKHLRTQTGTTRLAMLNLNKPAKARIARKTSSSRPDTGYRWDQTSSLGPTCCWMENPNAYSHGVCLSCNLARTTGGLWHAARPVNVAEILVNQTGGSSTPKQCGLMVPYKLRLTAVELFQGCFASSNCASQDAGASAGCIRLKSQEEALGQGCLEQDFAIETDHLANYKAMAHKVPLWEVLNPPAVFLSRHGW
eukprot:155687-Amphidinium_carterae.1